jgi:DNA (cytosine-5)-methyltransferase 1
MIHKFSYKWRLSDGFPAKGIEYNGLKVFGTFICGGGSTMGYKLAGYDHIGGVEIDTKVADVYEENHKPKYLYIEDIRNFVDRDQFPEELYKLDILDGSPPCSSFSMAGNREKDWKKQKKFSEGQAFQTLDDLFFYFIKLAGKLQPKIVIAENVKGLILGNAKSYVRKIVDSFSDIGYDTQLFLLNAKTMGVPQSRERVFFIARKRNLNLKKISFLFNEPEIIFDKIIDKNYLSFDLSDNEMRLWKLRNFGDRTFGDIVKRVENGRLSGFNNPIVHSDKVCPIITSFSRVGIYDLPRRINTKELISAGSFPTDYNFKNLKPQWLIGMSVPPIMTAQIAHQVYLQIFKK